MWSIFISVYDLPKKTLEVYKNQANDVWKTNKRHYSKNPVNSKKKSL